MTDPRFEMIGVHPQQPEPARKMRRHKPPYSTALILALIVLPCLFCELFLGVEPGYMDLTQCNIAPNSEHLFGTDALGRDVFAMIWHGGRVSLMIGLISAVIATVLAMLIGSVSALLPRWLDALLMRFTDILLSVPSLLLVLFLAVPSGIKVANVIDQTYESSISTTINEANNAAKEAEKSGNKGLFSGITDAISDSIDYVKNILNNFVEAFAVLLVTSCLIPLAVLAFLIWFIDFVFGININLPKMPKKKALAHKTLALEQAAETSEPTQEQ